MAAEISLEYIKEIDQIRDKDAKIFAAARMYVDGGLYVVPIRPNGKALPGKSYNFDYQHATKNPKVIEKWFGPGGKFEGWNLGLATGKNNGVFVVDLDVKPDVNGFKSFEEIAPKDYKFLGPVQKTPRGGAHMLYKWSENCSSSTNKIGTGVDTRGGDYDSCKGHIVVWPSTIDEGQYVWDKGGEPEEVPAFILDRLGRPWKMKEGSGRGNEHVEDYDQEKKWRLVDIEKMLEVIDPAELSYDEWLNIIQAIHTQYPDRFGLEVADKWSSRDESTGSDNRPRYQKGIVASKWASFKEGGDVRIGTLIHYARARGFELSQLDQRSPDQMDHMDHIVEEMNKEFAIVPLGSDVFILQEMKVPPELSRIQPGYRILKKAGFRSLFENQMEIEVMPDGKPIKSSRADIFLGHPDRRTYAGGLGLFPNKPKRYMDYYNLWQGFAVSPREGDWSAYRNHVRDVICAGDLALYEWVLDWMADLFQDPGNPKGTAIVMHGIEGCGKGTFCQMMGEVLGTHFKHITDEEHLIGRFNGHLADCILAFGDEVTYGGNRKVAGKLKAMVTEKYMTSERKGIDAGQFHNCVHLLVASNEDWFIPAGPQSRRWLVLDVAGHKANDRKYFDAIHTQMIKQDGLAAMLHDLLEREITSDLKKAPETKALQYQRAQYVNNNPTTAWISFQVLQGNLAVPDIDDSTGSGRWPDTVSKADVYQAYHQWCIDNRRRPAADVQFGKQMSEFGFEPARMRRNGNRIYTYKVPSYEELIQRLRSSGVDLELEETQNDED